MATALGTSRQTLSMLLNQMARDGVIERDGREIVILCDIVRLQSLENMSSS
ncbi:MAG: helix-turn-helix domain-containing protein [Pseudomonadota bacterium]